MGNNEKSDDDILIQAGDEWIGNETFMKNKEEFKRDIVLKRREKINKEIDHDADESDEELVILNKDKKSRQDLCPLTLKKIVHPIKNRLCSHVYERSAIINYRNYLVANDKPTKCPQAGCQATLFGF